MASNVVRFFQRPFQMAAAIVAEGPPFDPPNEPYKPSFVDVLVVREMVKKAGHLPAELVDDIIDLGEYWPHTTVETRGGHRVDVLQNDNVLLFRAPPVGMLHNPPDYNQEELDRVCMNREYTTQQTLEWLSKNGERTMRPLEHPVRKIVFTLESCDQGWGGPRRPPDARDPWYGGSTSWFDVGLERYDAGAAKDSSESASAANSTPSAGPSGRPSTAPPISSLRSIIPHVEKSPDTDGPAAPAPPGSPLVTNNHARAAPITHHSTGHVSHRGRPLVLPRPPPLRDDSDEDSFSRGSSSPPDSPPPVRLHHELNPSANALQHNRTANPRAYVHRIEWSWTDRQGPGEDPELTPAAMRAKGRGESTGNGEFVRSLRAGDVVTLWAKARFMGWKNRVSRARMEVYWAL